MVQPEVKVFTVLIADFIHKTFPPDLTRTYLVGEKVQEILKTVIVALYYDFRRWDLDRLPRCASATASLRWLAMQ